jgi:hypothetical protein
MSSSLYSTGCVKGASSLSLLQTLSSQHGALSSPPRALSFARNGIFNPLGLPARKGMVLPIRSGRVGQPRASSAELSFQDGYGRRRGRSIERPAPSTSGRSGLSSSNSSRSASLGLFVERTKNAIHWSSKRPLPRATVIEKKLKRSLTGDRQRDPNRLLQAVLSHFFFIHKKP